MEPEKPEDQEEDRRLVGVWQGCAIAGAIVAFVRSRYQMPPELAYALVAVIGLVAAALEAPTLRRQLAYTIPFVIIGFGQLWLCAAMDAASPKVLTPREFVAGAVAGSFPGIALYALVRWRL